MAIPASVEARRYYRIAKLRYEDAQILLKADHTNGAVYLAGYSVECMLKALVPSTVPGAAHAEIRTHSYEALRTTYWQHGGARFPSEITQAFTLVNTWSVDQRYDPRRVDPDDAEEFLRATLAIIEWADGRL